MNENLLEKCDLLCTGKDMLMNGVCIDRNMNNIAAGLVFSLYGQLPDVNKFKECKDILRSKTRFFNSFRTGFEYVLICKMVLKENPEEYLNQVLAIYERLRYYSVGQNANMGYAATIVCDLNKQDQAAEIVGTHRMIMESLKSRQALLTSYEDIPYTILLALSHRDTEVIVQDVLDCYAYLKERLKTDSNSIQGVSLTLALSEESVEVKCEKLLRFLKLYSDRQRQYKRDQGMNILGLLMKMKEEDEAFFVDEVIEVSDHLFKFKGFGNLDLGIPKRLCLATCLCAANKEIDDENLFQWDLQVIREISILLAMSFY